MMKIQLQRSFSLCGFCLFVLPAFLPLSNQASAASADYSLSATAQLEHIENPQRIPDNNDEELLSQLILQAGIDRATQNFATSINYTARKLDYDKDILADRTYVTGSSNFRWTPSSVFAWNLSNRRSLQQVDTLLPDTTDNRQVIEITSTGPELTFQLTGADRITSGYQYSWASYGDADLSGQERQSANIQYSHAFSGRLNTFVSLDALKSQFNSDLSPGFERYNYSIGSGYTTESFSLTLEAGESRSRVESGPDQSGLLLRANGEYTLNSLSSLTAFYSRSMEDMFSSLTNSRRLFEQDFIDDRLGNSNLTQIYRQTQYGVGYSYTRPESLQFNTEYAEYERQFAGSPLDQEDRRLSMSVNLPLSQNLDFSVYGRISDMDFPGQMREQRRREIGARSNYRISPRLSFRVAISAMEQNGITIMDNYDGFNALVSLTYRHDG